LTFAAKYWNIELDLVPSVTNSDGQIVLIRRATPKAKDQ
jgi:hypothetical protein